MSDNIAPDLIERELEARLRIPNEVWTDVMKMLPRRTLVKRIAPVCFRFKEIADKNVKSIHVITKANWFSFKLKKNDPIAKKQMEQLAANDCQLAGQFRLTRLRLIEENKAILRHCPDFFNGCAIGLHFKEKNKNSALFLECLAELEEAKPVVIYVEQDLNQVIDYWHNPTFQNCHRADLTFLLGLSASTVKNAFDWLHQQPKCDAAADQQFRCMILYHTGTGQKHIDWLINRCSEGIQQGREPIDRRPYVLCFNCWNSGWLGFDQFRRTVNKSTGEVLLLDRVTDKDGKPTFGYRLRRCQTEEEANGEEFYVGMFNRDYEIFNINEKTPKVLIGVKEEI